MRDVMESRLRATDEDSLLGTTSRSLRLLEYQDAMLFGYHDHNM